MKIEHVEKFNIIGISVRTSNNGQADKDIPALWKRFMEAGISKKIVDKIDEAIFCAYTEYEGDHTKPYTTVIGHKVENLNSIPDGMKGVSIEHSNYAKFVARGNLMEGAVINTWFNIWKTKLDRTYKTDFEVYGEKAQNPKDGEVEIFVGVK